MTARLTRPTAHVVRGREVTPEDLQRMQENLRGPIDALVEKPQLDAWLLEDVALEIGYINRVEHRLGRPVRGWHVVSLPEYATIYEIADPTGDTALWLPLVTDADCTVSLVVF